MQIIHKATWNVRTASAPLLINMIAIGSLYLPGQDDRAKVSLFVCHIVKMQANI